MKFNDAMKEIFEYIEKEEKENGKWEEGDELAFVCKDGIVIISCENRTLSVKVLAGKPVDMTHLELDLIEKDRESGS